MLSSVEPASRCQLYLTLALASVVKGNVLAAAVAADKALPLAEATAPEPATVAEILSPPAPATAGDGVLLASLRRLAVRGWPRLGRGTDAGRGAPRGVLTP